MNPGQYMDMGLNDSHLEYIGPFFPSHCPEKSAEKARQFEPDEPLTFARGPYQVDIQAMTHVQN
jgi:hypothetical protein